MSKRSTDNLRGMQEIRQDQNRNYGYYIKDRDKNVGSINPVFLQDHYGIKKPIKEAVKDE